jgi:hypothetical protein
MEQVYREPSAEKPPTRHARTLFHWSARYHWQARVSAWEDIKTAEDEAEWDERRRDIRKGEWEQAQTLLDRAEQMLKFPLAQVERVEETYSDGRSKAVTIVNPVRWSQRDIARFMQVASELGRLAAEMEQQRQIVEVRMGEDELNAAIEQELIRLRHIKEEPSKTRTDTLGTEAETNAAY